MDSPNLPPSPSSACASADSVALSSIGLTFSAIEVTVSNRVLNSVVTDRASITSRGEIRCRDGFSGALNDTYLLPNSVAASMVATTFAGIRLT